MTNANCFGIDIGGTKIAVLAGGEQDGGIAVAERRAFATIPGGPGENLAKITEILEDYRKKYGAPRGLGISCGGPLDVKRGLILSPPNLPGWDEVPIVRLMEERFGAPAAMENDADACALAEFRYGAGRGTEHMLFLTFGTGLGAGLILNGQLYRGATNGAGEVGHIRLRSDGPVGYHKAGSFEGFCSGGGLAQLGGMILAEHSKNGTATPWALENAGNTGLTAKALAEAARAGDAVACEVFEVCGNMLGEGLAVLIDVLNPERIVVGSIFARCEELLVPAMRAAIGREALRQNADACAVVAAQLGEQIGDIAALGVAVGAQKR